MCCSHIVCLGQDSAYSRAQDCAVRAACQTRRVGMMACKLPVAIICLGGFLVFALDVSDLIDDQLFEVACGALEVVDSVGDLCLDSIAFGHGRVLDLQELVSGLINNLQDTGQTVIDRKMC